MARLLALITAVLVAGPSCTDRTPKQVLGVSSKDFSRPAAAAVKIINGFAGCDFLVFTPNDNATIDIRSDDGEPCGQPFHELVGDGHSAAAYRCPGRNPQFEILIASPGDIHDQACIAAHEIGHALGLQDGGKGIMNQHDCPDFIRLSDAEVDQLRAKFCTKP